MIDKFLFRCGTLVRSRAAWRCLAQFSVIEGPCSGGGLHHMRSGEVRVIICCFRLGQVRSPPYCPAVSVIAATLYREMKLAAGLCMYRLTHKEAGMAVG